MIAAARKKGLKVFYLTEAADDGTGSSNKIIAMGHGYVRLIEVSERDLELREWVTRNDGLLAEEKQMRGVTGNRYFFFKSYLLQPGSWEREVGSW